MKVCEAIRGNFRSAGARVIRAVETFAILGRFSLEHRSRSIRRDKERDRVRREEGGRERERVREAEAEADCFCLNPLLERLVILLLSGRRVIH